MGAWGTGLYSNDCTLDVKDDYRLYLKLLQDNQKAYDKLIETYEELFETDEECLFWYALADTQWKLGRLTPEVKDKALFWIDCMGGLEMWDGDKCDERGWRKTLEKLKSRLDSPMPEEKKISKPRDFDRNPWKIGDIYAIQFIDPETKELGLYGKYLALQKVDQLTVYNDREHPEGVTYPVLQAYDKIFAEVPKLEDLEGVRILPLIYPNAISRIGASATIYAFKASDYPRKCLAYVGNSSNYNLYPRVKFGEGLCFWSSLTGSHLATIYLEWQKYDYTFEGERKRIVERGLCTQTEHKGTVNAKIKG